MNEHEMNDLINYANRLIRGADGIVVRNPKQPIRHIRPHYTNAHFKHARTVYIADGHLIPDNDETLAIEGIAYQYSDRIRENFEWEKSRQSWDTVRETHSNTDTAAAHELWLRLMYDDPELELVHILAGFNWSNGYDYQVYGFIPSQKDK